MSGHAAWLITPLQKASLRGRSDIDPAGWRGFFVGGGNGLIGSHVNIAVACRASSGAPGDSMLLFANECRRS